MDHFQEHFQSSRLLYLNFNIHHFHFHLLTQQVFIEDLICVLGRLLALGIYKEHNMENIGKREFVFQYKNGKEK